MAENDETTQARKRPTATDESGPDKFSVEDLVARATDFLGQPSFVVAGALHGVKGPLTLDAAQKKVAAYLESPATAEEE